MSKSLTRLRKFDIIKFNRGQFAPRCEYITQGGRIVTNIKVCAPSRLYSSHENGSFSVTAMVDYMALVGFDGIDMSLEGISSADDSYKSVLYSAKNRAVSKGIEIPSCHLPFYMPNPSDKILMDRFAKDITAGISAAAYMQIPLAVIHPIALHSQRASAEEWARRNIGFLSPICEFAYKMGVSLCLENMASKCEGTADHLFGSTAQEILSLSGALGIKICWDFGHAHIAKIPETEAARLGQSLALVHAHDNNGYDDEHLPVSDGKICWDNAARALGRIGYCGYISMEAKSWHISPDRDIREQFGRRVAYLGRRFANMIKQSTISLDGRLERI